MCDQQKTWSIAEDGVEKVDGRGGSRLGSRCIIVVVEMNEVVTRFVATGYCMKIVVCGQNLLSATKLTSVLQCS